LRKTGRNVGSLIKKQTKQTIKNRALKMPPLKMKAKILLAITAILPVIIMAESCPECQSDSGSETPCVMKTVYQPAIRRCVQGTTTYECRLESQATTITVSIYYADGPECNWKLDEQFTTQNYQCFTDSLACQS
jgi:hypothetical protein